MSRPDLSSEFAGWQVCDPTPQETSDGKLDFSFSTLFCAQPLCNWTDVLWVRNLQRIIHGSGQVVVYQTVAHYVKFRIVNSCTLTLMCGVRCVLLWTSTCESHQGRRVDQAVWCSICVCRGESLQNMTSTADPNLYFSSLYPLFPLHMYNISYAPHNFSTKMSEHSGGLRPTEDIWG